jgi:GDP-mannose 6-dehydrogenase
MRISILGLGYVGAVSAACLARDGHDVIGCDVDRAKLDLIRGGQTPIIEEGMQELISEAVGSGRLRVMDDAEEAVRRSELSFICVGTPSLRNGDQDLSAIRRVSEQVGRGLRDRDDYHLCVLRSTVLPGTMTELIRPTVEDASGKTGGQDFGLCFQPEFLREGSSIRDYDAPPLTLVGADNERSADILRKVFGHLPCDFVVTGVGSAELLKYCSNTFHALKITFANEIGRIAQSLGVDSHEVMQLVCRDRQLNISPAYLKPGFAFGGSCLPKDLRALLYAARKNDVEVPMLSGVMPSNLVHVDHAVDFVLRTGRKSVGMIGLSFKPGTDDLRESPLVTMAERFIGKGLKLSIYDPAVSIAKLVGANRRFIEESIPHISSLMVSTCVDVIREADVLVLGQTNPDLLDCLYENSREDQILLDLVGVSAPQRIRGTYQGVCW